MHKNIQRFIPALVLLPLLLASCAVRPGDPPTLDRIKPLLRLAVVLSTDRLCTKNPTAVPLLLSVVVVLEDVANAGDFTSIATIGAVVRAKIPWETLPPNSRPVVEMLIDLLSTELRVLVEQVQIPETQAVLLIRDMLGWVKEVAGRYVVPTPATGKIGK
jgi:hypothetical protein